MRAMIMSAGRGKRLRPITDTLPKPLVTVGEKPLIVHHIEALRNVGVQDIVINLGHLGGKIRAVLGHGQALGVNIAYTNEPELLEVGGGIANALPLLGEAPFIIVNGDIWTDYDYQLLLTRSVKLGHIVLVPNPDHNQAGDYALMDEQVLLPQSQATTYTYAGIALYHPQLFIGVTGSHPMKPILDKAIQSFAMSGEIYRGRWSDVGTIARLQTLRKCVADCAAFKSN